MFYKTDSFSFVTLNAIQSGHKYAVCDAVISLLVPCTAPNIWVILISGLSAQPAIHLPRGGATQPIGSTKGDDLSIGEVIEDHKNNGTHY